MKAILALLLGLISQSWADSDSVLLDFESLDSDEISTGGDSANNEATSFGGLIIQVRQGTDESPTVALGSDIDDYDDVYCLNFQGLFEASSYDTNTTTSAAFTRIDNSFSDLADANCTSSQRDTGSDAAILFSIRCTNIGDGDATLTLTFSFIQDAAGDYGLEYIINLAGYELSDGATNLVLVQSLNECGDTIDLESAEEETDGASTTEEPDTEPTETESAEDTTTTEPNRRRLLQFSSTDSAEPTDDPEPTEVRDDPEGTEDSMEETEVSDTESGEDEDSTDDASADDESTDASTDESTDEESLEEEDGISEDDSGEFDTGFARFVVNGQALDVCGEDQREIGSTLVYQPNEGDDGELHIVFDSFNCTLVLDPFYGLDDSKYQVRFGSNDASTTAKPSTTEDNAHRYGAMIAMVIGLFAYLW